MASFRTEIPPPLGIPLPLESDTDYLLNSPISLSKKFGHVFLFLYSICFLFKQSYTKDENRNKLYGAGAKHTFQQFLSFEMSGVNSEKQSFFYFNKIKDSTKINALQCWTIELSGWTFLQCKNAKPVRSLKGAVSTLIAGIKEGFKLR